jgi:hypothetical protein
MLRRALLLLAALGAFGSTKALAGDVLEARPVRSGSWLVVDLRTVDLLDARTRSTVESGLPGTCLLQIELRDDRGAVTARRLVERSLEFDLWENVVRLIEGTQERVFATLAAADSSWSRFEALRLAPWSQLLPQRNYHLRVRLDVVPLGAEERQRVSQWVSRSERGDRRELSLDVGGLVARFLGGSDAEADATVWRGPDFRLDAVDSREPEPEP